MQLSKRPLVVRANPYLAIDHDGRLSGACPRDVTVSAGMRLYIGAEVDTAATREVRQAPSGDAVMYRGKPLSGGSGQQARHSIAFRFEPGNVDIEDTLDHRARVRQGEVLAGDERTHKRVFGATAKFIPPDQALEAARAGAVADWKAGHDGDDPPFAEWDWQLTSLEQRAARRAEEAEAAKAVEGERGNARKGGGK